MNLELLLRALGYSTEERDRPRARQVRQARAALVERMKPIVERAERENRNLNASERGDYDSLQRQYTAHTDLIDALEAAEERSLSEARTIGGGSTDGTGSAFSQPDRRAARSAALTRSQSMAEHVRGLGYRIEGGADLGLSKTIRGMLLGDWRGADLERRALLESNSASAGVLVPAPMSARIIDLARAKARVMQAGALTVPMESSTLKICRQTGDPSLTWHTEGETINESGMTFDAVTLRAHTLPCLVKFSLELLEDVDNLDTIVESAVAAAMAGEIDRVAMRGSGVDPEPKGLRNQTGVTVIPATGADSDAATWETLVAAVAAVRGNDFDPNAAILAERTQRDLGTQRENGATGPYLAAPPYLDDVSRLGTTRIPVNQTQGTSTDASEIYTGQWDQLLIGMRTSFSVQALNELYADTGERAVLCHMRVDVAPANGAAFAVSTGIVPSA